jgi:hypothetical protein
MYDGLPVLQRLLLGHTGGTFQTGAQPGLTGRSFRLPVPSSYLLVFSIFLTLFAPGIASQQGDGFYERLLCDTLPAALRRPYALPEHEAVLSQGHEC